MLRDALHAPGRAEDAAGTLVVGVILTLVTAIVVPAWLAFTLMVPLAVVLAPIALAPTFVVRGYYVRVIAAGIDGAPATPSFVRWGTLYRDGLKSVLLSIGYLLPLAALLALGGLATRFINNGRVDSQPFGEAVLAIALLFLALLAIGYLVVYAYLRPAGLAVFTASGRLRDAFDPRTVGRVAVDAEFATGWLLATFVLLAGLVVATPFYVLLVGFALGFYVQIVTHLLYGEGAAASIESDAELATETKTPNGQSDVRPSDASPSDASTTDYPASTAAATEPEVDPAVQTGRSVPFPGTSIPPKSASQRPGTDSDATTDTGTADDDTDDDEADAFEWGNMADR